MFSSMMTTMCVYGVEFSGTLPQGTPPPPPPPAGVVTVAAGDDWSEVLVAASKASTVYE